MLKKYRQPVIYVTDMQVTSWVLASGQVTTFQDDNVVTNLWEGEK